MVILSVSLSCLYVNLKDWKIVSYYFSIFNFWAYIGTSILLKPLILGKSVHYIVVSRIKNIGIYKINPFHTTGPFLHPWNIKKLWFSEVFRGYRKRPMI